MAKVTIIFEDEEGEVDIKTHFDPQPPTNPEEFTNAQDAAFFLLDRLTNANQCKEVKVNGTSVELQ